MMAKKNLAIFISGRGSNARALFAATHNDDYPAKVCLLVSDKRDASGLALARDHHIPTHIISDDDALLACLHQHAIDIICLAGFMTILSGYFLQQWNKPIVNIHPSLLPRHKGLRVHERVLASGDDTSGCTVHHVTSKLDGGATIAQETVTVHKHDTPDSLAARVLAKEHHLYPQAVRQLIAGSHKT